MPRATGAGRQQLQQGERGQRLARSALADDRQAFAAVQREGDIVHHAPRAEGDAQIPDLDQAHRGCRRGSKLSRTASPTKISSVSTPPSTTKAVTPSQGACRLFLPWLTSSPSEGEPGGRPKPRKSSEARMVTEPESVKGRKVMVATSALGRMWRHMMKTFDTPSARAART